MTSIPSTTEPDPAAAPKKAVWRAPQSVVLVIVMAAAAAGFWAFGRELTLV